MTICPLKFSQATPIGNPNNTCTCEKQACAWYVKDCGCAVLIGAVKVVNGQPELRPDNDCNW